MNHLLQDCARDDAAWESYTSISKVRERLEDGWNDDDEEALGKNDVTYAAMQKEIEELQAVSDPAAVEGPLRMVLRDPELIAAAYDLESKLRTLDGQLSL